MSGTYSHYREGNTHIKIGLIVGLFASVGSFLGAKFASLIPAQYLQWLTESMLFLSALLFLLKLFIIKESSSEELTVSNFNAWTKGILLGILSGTFGIGSAPFIQIGLMVLLNLTVRQSVGTTMLVIIPIALGGGIGNFYEGYVKLSLLVQVLIGTMCGSYIGAKFTNLAPKVVLKISLILTPLTAGTIMLI